MIKKTSTHPTARANRCAWLSAHQGSSREETGARETGRGGVWVGGQKGLDASAHQGRTAADDLAQGRVGGGLHLCPLRGWLLGGGLGQFGPDFLPVVGAQLLPCHGPARCHLNSRAVLYRHRSTRSPVGHSALDNADGAGKLANPFSHGYCGVECVHGPILITNVIRTQHLCD